jgi:hypothetical protein
LERAEFALPQLSRADFAADLPPKNPEYEMKQWQKLCGIRKRAACFWLSMKRHSTLHVHRSILLVMAVAAYVATPLLHAQKANPQPETPPLDPGKRVTLQFREASIEEAAEFLAKQFEGANFVVPATVARLRVTLKLRNVTLEQALQAIAFATENRVNTSQVAENVYGFSFIGAEQRGSPPEERAACRIFSLASAPSFAGNSPDKVNKMIEELKGTLDSAIKMLRDAEPTSSVDVPQLQFHPSTKLLIAVGKPEELAIIEQLVSALGGGAPEIPQPGVPGAAGAAGGFPGNPAGFGNPAPKPGF